MNVIKKGDLGSDLLSNVISDTAKNNEFGGLRKYGNEVISLSHAPDHYFVVHTHSGDHRIKDPADHVASLVKRLLAQAKDLDATPIGMTNMIVSPDGDLQTLEKARDTLGEHANQHKFRIQGGENAIHGYRMALPLHMQGAMISIIPKSQWHDGQGVFPMGDSLYAVFDAGEDYVFMNTDGDGTKPEAHERLAKFMFSDRPLLQGVDDLIAMLWDDGAKKGGKARVLAANLHYTHLVSTHRFRNHLSKRAGYFNMMSILQGECVGDAIRGYAPGERAYDLGGALVSTLSEERLNTPLIPRAGQKLVVVTGIENGRCNGYTKRREIAKMLGGDEWHTTPAGQEMSEYLSRPSTIFAPFFLEAINKGLATSVYHMSGGALDGKLARPLAKYGLFVKLNDLYPLHPIEERFAREGLGSLEAAAKKWPLNNDAYGSTDDAESLIGLAHTCGLKAKVAGVLEMNGRTGVEIELDGKLLYLNGKST